jgi:tRNA A37 threonylcarbamoyladenosine biosynthesis protein TsaE
MGRLMFDSSGKLMSVDGNDVEKEKKVDEIKRKKFGKKQGSGVDFGDNLTNDSLDKRDLDEKFGRNNRGKSSFEDRNFKAENKSSFGSLSNSEKFGLLNHEKIERVGWGDKKRGFNSRSFNKKDEFSENNFREKKKGFGWKDKFVENFYEDHNDDFDSQNMELKKIDSLNFLKNDLDDFSNENYNIDQIKNRYWNFYSDDEFLQPLKFSNNKTQEDVVREVVRLVKKGEKIIFLKGVCGSGKSAIALNIARALGKAAIVVPLKSLQKQYEDDYSNKKYLIKPDLKRLKIASITGKDNHDSVYRPGISCADKSLPENIVINEKNSFDIMEYYSKNDFNEQKDNLEIKDIKRTWIAPANPYWSPILPIEFEVSNLKDAKKYRYKGCNGKEFVFYHRRNGCSYYDQYLAYIHADVLIYNSAKYKSELLLLKKPETEVDIIDEADEFLDSLFNQKEINLKKFYDSLIEINIESKSAKDSKFKILRLLELEFSNNNYTYQKGSTGSNTLNDFSGKSGEFNNSPINEDIKNVNKTNLLKVFKILLENKDLISEISIEELNYCNKVSEIVKSFSETIEDLYLSYKIIGQSLIVSLVTSDLTGCISEITSKNNAMVFMSGTLHSEEVIKNILGIKNYSVVEAETINQGNLEIIRTGREFNCQYSTFSQKEFTREDYLYSISECIKRAKLPALIHVNAFRDLPTDIELDDTGISNLISGEKLRNNQKLDKLGDDVIKFKKKESDKLFTTRCSRGMDFPGDICNSVLFTKYPNPNINDIFWKILKKTYPNSFWSFYKDKAKREFLQRIYRALRSYDDHIYVLSPDLRVLDAVRELQMEGERVI